MEVDKSTTPDSSGDNCTQPNQSEDAKPSVASNGSGDTCNGEVTDSKQSVGEESNITSSNGSVSPVKGKNKGEYVINKFYVKILLILCCVANLFSFYVNAIIHRLIYCTSTYDIEIRLVL